MVRRHLHLSSSQLSRGHVKLLGYRVKALEIGGQGVILKAGEAAILESVVLLLGPVT